MCTIMRTFLACELLLVFFQLVCAGWHKQMGGTEPRELFILLLCLMLLVMRLCMKRHKCAVLSFVVLYGG